MKSRLLCIALTIVLLVLCMTSCGVQDTSSSNNESKSEIIISSSPHRSESGQRSTSTSPSTATNKQVSTATSKTVSTSGQSKATNKATSTTVKSDKTSKPVAADKWGFGIWGLAPAYPTNTTTTMEAFQQQVDRNYMNHHILQAKATDEFFESMRVINESGSMTGFYDTKTWRLRPDSAWKEDLDLLVQALKDTGLWDNIAGFVWDEPDLKPVPHDDFIRQTEYLSNKYNKRLFTVFSVAGFAPEYLPAFPRPQITAESTKYLTDIAFDMYGIHNKDEYRKVNQRLKDAVGRPDEVRVWYFPVAFEALGERKDEKYAIDFLNMCYELLLEEERPGGLILYCWPTWTHEIGLEDLLPKKQFTHYDKLMLRIGKQVIKKTLD